MVMPLARNALLSVAALSNVREFVEQTIVLKKDKGIGIRVAGGSDSYLEQICVVCVERGGAAAEDGRLRTGDVILAVNEVSFREACLRDAARCLREAASPVRLVILRENPQALFTTHSPPTHFITVELRKGSGNDSLGLSIMQRMNGQGVFVTYVRPGSLSSGRRICQGDQILEVNGRCVRDANQKDVAQLIRRVEVGCPVVLLLGRCAALHASVTEWAKWKSRQRARTATWCAAAPTKHIQMQRPSLPVSKDALGFTALAAALVPALVPTSSSKDLPTILVTSF